MSDLRIPPDIASPAWDEGGRVHNWRNHVPEHICEGWPTYTPEVRIALYRWAESLAVGEEWE